MVGRLAAGPPVYMPPVAGSLPNWAGIARCPLFSCVLRDGIHNQWALVKRLCMTFDVQVSYTHYRRIMRNPPAQLRLSPILHAYLDDLVSVGVFGKDKSAVMRRFIEEGIQRAMAANAVARKDVGDFGGSEEE